MLLSPIHISFLVECDVAQLALLYQALRNGLLDYVVNQIVQTIHLYEKYFGEVSIEFDWEYPYPSQRYPHLLQLHRLHYLVPLGQILLCVQSEHQDGGMEGLNGHQRVQIILLNYCFYHIFVGLSASLRQRYLYEVSGSFLPERRPLSRHLGHHFRLLLLAFSGFGVSFITYFFLLGHFSGGFADVLSRVVVEVALQVIRVNIVLLVDLVDVFGMEVDVLSAFEVETGEQVLFEAPEVVVGDQVGFVVDFDCGGSQEWVVHNKQSYQYQHYIFFDLIPQLTLSLQHYQQQVYLSLMPQLSLSQHHLCPNYLSILITMSSSSYSYWLCTPLYADDFPYFFGSQCCKLQLKKQMGAISTKVLQFSTKPTNIVHETLTMQPKLCQLPPFLSYNRQAAQMIKKVRSERGSMEIRLKSSAKAAEPKSMLVRRPISRL